jgi:hypothetical protein
VLRISVIAQDGEKYVSTPDIQFNIQQLTAKTHHYYRQVTTPDTRIGGSTMQAAVKMSPDHPKALALLAHSTTQMHPLIRFETSQSNP